MNTLKRGKCCKWCQISETTLAYLVDVDRRTYCTNESGHEWIEEEDVEY